MLGCSAKEEEETDFEGNLVNTWKHQYVINLFVITYIQMLSIFDRYFNKCNVHWSVKRSLLFALKNCTLSFNIKTLLCTYWLLTKSILYETYSVSIYFSNNITTVNMNVRNVNIKTDWPLSWVSNIYLSQIIMTTI